MLLYNLQWQQLFLHRDLFNMKIKLKENQIRLLIQHILKKQLLSETRINPEEVKKRAMGLDGVDTYDIFGSLSKFVTDSIKMGTTAFGQGFENISIAALKKQGLATSISDLNPDTTGASTEANAAFADLIFNAGVGYSAGTPLSLSDFDNCFLVSAKSVKGPKEFEGKAAPKKLRTLLASPASSPLNQNAIIPSGCIRLKAGAVYIALDPDNTFGQKKLVYDVQIALPTEFNIGIMKQAVGGATEALDTKNTHFKDNLSKFLDGNYKKPKGGHNPYSTSLKKLYHLIMAASMDNYTFPLVIATPANITSVSQKNILFFNESSGILPKSTDTAYSTKISLQSGDHQTSMQNMYNYFKNFIDNTDQTSDVNYDNLYNHLMSEVANISASNYTKTVVAIKIYVLNHIDDSILNGITIDSSANRSTLGTMAKTLRPYGNRLKNVALNYKTAMTGPLGFASTNIPGLDLNSIVTTLKSKLAEMEIVYNTQGFNTHSSYTSLKTLLEDTLELNNNPTDPFYFIQAPQADEVTFKTSMIPPVITRVYPQNSIFMLNGNVNQMKQYYEKKVATENEYTNLSNPAMLNTTQAVTLTPGIAAADAVGDILRQGKVYAISTNHGNAHSALPVIHNIVEDVKPSSNFSTFLSLFMQPGKYNYHYLKYVITAADPGITAAGTSDFQSSMIIAHMVDLISVLDPTSSWSSRRQYSDYPAESPRKIDKDSLTLHFNNLQTNLNNLKTALAGYTQIDATDKSRLMQLAVTLGTLLNSSIVPVDHVIYVMQLIANQIPVMQTKYVTEHRNLDIDNVLPFNRYDEFQHEDDTIYAGAILSFLIESILKNVNSFDDIVNAFYSGLKIIIKEIFHKPPFFVNKNNEKLQDITSLPMAAESRLYENILKKLLKYKL